jgi:ribosome-binding factor A
MFAKAYISVLGNSVEKRQVFVWLCENVGQIRYSLAKRLRSMRRVPEISFKLSDTKNMMDLVDLIEEISPQNKSDDDEIEFEEDDDDE